MSCKQDSRHWKWSTTGQTHSGLNSRAWKFVLLNNENWIEFWLEGVTRHLLLPVTLTVTNPPNEEERERVQYSIIYLRSRGANTVWRVVMLLGKNSSLFQLHYSVIKRSVPTTQILLSWKCTTRELLRDFRYQCTGKVLSYIFWCEHWHTWLFFENISIRDRT